MEDVFPLVAWRARAILRRCRRCRQWRSIGNFSHSRAKAHQEMSNGKVCHKCPRDGTHRINRAGWTITDLGRAYLHPERAERVG